MHIWASVVIIIPHWVENPNKGHCKAVSQGCKRRQWLPFFIECTLFALLRKWFACPELLYHQKEESSVMIGARYLDRYHWHQDRINCYCAYPLSVSSSVIRHWESFPRRVTSSERVDITSYSDCVSHCRVTNITSLTWNSAVARQT